MDSGILFGSAGTYVPILGLRSQDHFMYEPTSVTIENKPWNQPPRKNYDYRNVMAQQLQNARQTLAAGTMLSAGSAIIGSIFNGLIGFSASREMFGGMKNKTFNPIRYSKSTTGASTRHASLSPLG